MTAISRWARSAPPETEIELCSTPAGVPAIQRRTVLLAPLPGCDFHLIELPAVALALTAG